MAPNQQEVAKSEQESEESSDDVDDNSEATSSGESSASETMELIDLPVNMRLLIYNYMTLSELMETILKLSKNEKKAIVDYLQKHEEFQRGKLVLHLNSRFEP